VGTDFPPKLVLTAGKLTCSLESGVSAVLLLDSRILVKFQELNRVQSVGAAKPIPSSSFEVNCVNVALVSVAISPTRAEKGGREFVK
jgi:hypothetical protein